VTTPTLIPIASAASERPDVIPASLRLVQRQPAASVQPDHRAHVLIVEDDIAGREMLAIFLQRRGFRVWMAGTAAEALATITHKRPDLLMVDLSLPRISGGALIRMVRRLPATSDLPIMIVSAHATSRDVRLGLAIGADDYLVKPLDLARVEARILALLRRHAHPRVALLTAPDPLPLDAPSPFGVPVMNE
jgi:DNA-binding response OmpR family regulator